MNSDPLDPSDSADDARGSTTLPEQELDGQASTPAQPSTELVLLFRAQPDQPDHTDQADQADPIAEAIALAAGLANRAVAVGEQVARSATNAVLDRTVPVILQAVLDRVDLTQLILDRVDVDRIVAQANLEEIIDRLPLVDVANYVIDEINLPQIVRESTGGIAGDAVNLLRMQSIDVDQALSRLADVMLRRRGPGRKEPPAGEPASDGG